MTGKKTPLGSFATLMFIIAMTVTFKYISYLFINFKNVITKHCFVIWIEVPNVYIVKKFRFISLTFILLIIALNLNVAYCNTYYENKTCLELKKQYKCILIKTWHIVKIITIELGILTETNRKLEWKPGRTDFLQWTNKEKF